MLGSRKTHESDSLPPLSLEQCYAKTIQEDSGEVQPGLRVEDHCTIVGLVAREIVNRVSSTASEKLFPAGSEMIAAVHDIGKINPDFQTKIYRSAGMNVESVEALKIGRPEREKSYGYHSAVSQAALKNVDRRISEIVGKHHGYSTLTPPLVDDASIGGQAWQNVRMELIERLREFYGCSWPVISSDTQALALAGLTAVADWVGSGPIFDKLVQAQKADLQSLVELAVDAAGFIRPKVLQDLSFSQVFNGYTPRPVQEALISMTDFPGIFILEALMGEGKTEAALYAAYRLMAEGKASGIYFALPTRLTSDKIHERMSAFLNNILDPEDRHSVQLAHAQAWLYETELGEDGSPGYSWFNAKKRALLAPFAVGTIDQALMAVMNVKHGFVRAFGLAGKVVILDEVHSYDAYTGTIMNRLVSTLRELGSTVILLSATLSGKRKESLISMQADPEKDAMYAKSYPLITKASMDGQLSYSQAVLGGEKKISLHCTANEQKVINQVRDKVFNGENVLWIENTVNDAQEIYKQFASWGRENSFEIGLLHSRLPAKNRRNIEDYWVGILGKAGASTRKIKGKLLIGTQILEQSLDIDADFLVTRIAPTDMILQRIGRLWRHEENARPATATAAATILVPEPLSLSGSLKYAFGASGAVYAPYVLGRSLEVLSELKELKIPGDLRQLIEATYEDRNETDTFKSAKRELEQRKETLERFARLSVASNGQTLPESAPTRYSDLTYCDVLLLSRDVFPGDEVVHFYDGTIMQLNVDGKYLHVEKKRCIRNLNEHLFSVPTYIAPDPIPLHELKWIKPLMYLSENEEERLRVAVVESSGEIRGCGDKIANKDYQLRFSDEIGYSTQKRSVDGKSL